VEADVAVGVEEADGPDGPGWWRQFIQQLVEQLALRAARFSCGDAGFVVPAGEFLGIDQGQGVGGHDGKSFGHKKHKKRKNKARLTTDGTNSVKHGGFYTKQAKSAKVGRFSAILACFCGSGLEFGLLRLEAGEGLGKVWGVTTAVANAIAKMTKRQKLALADQLRGEVGTRSSVTKTSRKPKTVRPRFVRSKITGMIVSTGPKGAPRVSSEQVRALLADFP
jgi:hypothetical protein